MKLKSFAKLLMSCVVAGALFTGCGTSSDKPAETPEGKVGMLTRLNATEAQIGELYGKVLGDKRQPKFYDNLRSMELAINSGDVQEISLYKCVADYLVTRSDKFEIVPDAAINAINDSFCFAVRKDNTALKTELDNAIDAMKADGTLDKLINEFITNVDKGQAPPKVDIPVTEGAPVLKVGVTGDLPPLDFMNADNTTAGFNTALLAEVAKRLGRNIEFVQVETGSRAVALTSNLIDAAFWAIVPLSDKIPADIDKPEGLDLSKPYFKDSVARLKLKSDK